MRDFIRDAHPIILNSWTYFRGQDHAILEQVSTRGLIFDHLTTDHEHRDTSLNSRSWTYLRSIDHGQ